MRSVGRWVAVLASHLATGIVGLLHCSVIESAEPARSVTTANGPEFLEEIVVTATRRPTLLAETGETGAPPLEALWRNHARTLALVETRGDHSTMLSAPNADSTAAALARCLCVPGAGERSAH